MTSLVDQAIDLFLYFPIRRNLIRSDISQSAAELLLKFKLP